MGVNPDELITDEKHAPTFILKSLETVSRLLKIVGKPFYILLYLPIIATIFILETTGRIIRYVYSIIPKRGLKKKGVIFSSKNLKRKIIVNIYKKRLKEILAYLSKLFISSRHKTKDFYWTAQVFFLAVKKFATKLAFFIRIKFLNLQPGKKVKNITRFFIFKVNLKLIQLTTHIPRPSLSKIPKLRIFWSFTIFFLILGFSLSFLLWFYVLKGLPSVNNLNERKLPISTKIYDRNGILLYTIFKNENRTPLPLSSIPVQVRLATIAVEDAEFYNHPGFSVRGILRALIKNIKEGELTGGSTITQQLVKNTLLTPEKTFQRKLKEAVLAIRVELAFDKDKILEMYLNEVSFGGTAYGIQEASRLYFGKDVKDLSLAEAALLAGLPKSPTQYSPFGTNPEMTLSRQKEVLKLMYVNGFITNEQKYGAENEAIEYSNKRIDIKAPHFVFFVKEKLEEKYGSEIVETGGLNVTTTLDFGVQNLAEKVVKEEVEKLKKLNVTNASVVVLNPKSGEILAMVGSKDYFDTGTDGNVNVATRLRQPGSSIKIVNYAYALSNGLSPASLVKDSPVTFNVDGQPPYTPKNYEGGYRGTISVRSALAESRNIPAVRVLASYGVSHMIEMGQKMGISSWNNPSSYGLSLTLGGGEVKLIDLARAYATLANYGKRPEIISTLKVTNFKNKILEEFNCDKNLLEQVVKVEDETLINQLTDRQINTVSAASESAIGISLIKNKDCEGERVLDERVAFIITDILKDNAARAPSFGSNSLLVIPNHPEVAVKTGTSNDLKDNLAIGYTQNYLVAVWVGNNDNSPMSRIASGVTGATPIWNKIMSTLLNQGGNVLASKNPSWEIPEGLINLPICTLTGTLSCQGCPTKKEWFLEENKPSLACNPGWFEIQNDDNSQIREEKNQEIQSPSEQIIYPSQTLSSSFNQPGIKRRDKEKDKRH